MKRSKRCPKCNNSTIFVAPGWTGSHNSGQYIRLPGFHLVSASVKFDKYICGECGYVEEWIPSGKELERIKQNLEVS